MCVCVCVCGREKNVRFKNLIGRNNTHSMGHPITLLVYSTHFHSFLLSFYHILVTSGYSWSINLIQTYLYVFDSTMSI